MSHIKTFARIKPAKDLYEDYEIRGKIFVLRVPELVRDYGGPLVKNRIPTISYDFKFDKIFNPNTNQEETYSAAAQEIVAGGPYIIYIFYVLVKYSNILCVCVCIYVNIYIYMCTVVCACYEYT